MSDDKRYYASVVFDKGINAPLDYEIPAHLSLKIGSRVLAPLRNAKRQGTVVAIKDKASFPKVKMIDSLYTENISEDLYELAKFISSYYCSPFRKVLTSIMPGSVRKDVQEKTQLFVKRNQSKEAIRQAAERLSLKGSPQGKVLEVILKKPTGILLTELLELSQVSKSPVDTLIKNKILKIEKIQIDRSLLEEDEFFPTKPKVLNKEQQIAFDNIFAKDKPHLLFGITGSGKTEIYLQAIQKVRNENKGIIMLVPEIALTTQTIERFRARFSEKIGILHHRLSDGERYDTWHAIKEGKIQIVIGARSSIFAPVKDLGLIIVDEEHESSYKQTDEMPCYNARDIAILRAKISKAKVILGSATPSLESYYHTTTGKYNLHTLTTRPENSKLPEVTIVDMKKEYERNSGYTLFSDALLDGIKKRYQKGEQTLLFLNRRGYNSFQLCTSCGESVKCQHCEISLTHHKNQKELTCHLCGYSMPPPRCCPSCDSKEHLAFKGIGTEQIERHLHAIFPEIRTLRMDADTTKHKGSHDKLFKQFKSGKADVLIGTQMIAKGLHFPAVTLVGIISAETALNLPDFRAEENTFQLLTQVAGRSGRGEIPGEVIIQTSMPNHNTIQYASKENYLAFFNQEIENRKIFSYPPFSHLVKVTFSSKDEEKTKNAASIMYESLVKSLPSSFEIYPPIPSGYAKIKDNYRFKLLIKGEKIFTLSKALSTFSFNGIKILIDVDPSSTFF